MQVMGYTAGQIDAELANTYPLALTTHAADGLTVFSLADTDVLHSNGIGCVNPDYALNFAQSAYAAGGSPSG